MRSAPFTQPPTAFALSGPGASEFVGHAANARAEAQGAAAAVILFASDARVQRQGLARVTSSFDHLAELSCKRADDVAAKARLAA
jgi:hypothetical protein